MSSFISLNNVIPRISDSPFAEPVNRQINRDEVWGVLGPNRSGKSLLVEIIRGRIGVKSGKVRYHFSEDPEEKTGFEFPAQRISKIDFNTAYSLLDYRKLFYQQRFNNSENEEIPIDNSPYQINGYIYYIIKRNIHS